MKPLPQTAVAVGVLAMMATGCASPSVGKPFHQTTPVATKHLTSAIARGQADIQPAPRNEMSSIQVSREMTSHVANVQATVTGKPYGYGMNVVDFVSKRVGYLAGQGIILKTVDGGQTFETSVRSNVNVVGLASAPASSGTLVGWGRHQLFISHDGGATWMTSRLGTKDTEVNQVAFANAKDGFAIVGRGNEGQVWESSNGGQTWQKSSTAPGGVTSISFGDATNGWMGTGNGDIFATTNGGREWKRVFQPLGKFPGVPMVQATSAHSCWVMVIGGSGMSQTAYSVFRTVDGDHFSPVLGINTAGAGPAPDGAPHAPQGPLSSPGPLVGLSPTSAVVLGICRACGMGMGQVSSTSNGGQSWKNYPTIENGMTAPTSASFVSLQDGWVLDAAYQGGSFLLHTTDGGAHWSEVYPMAHPHPVDGVSFLNRNIGYGLGAPGDANIVLKSVDGGKRWFAVGRLPSHDSNNMVNNQGSVIQFINVKQGYAVGDDGVVYETENGGQSWYKSNIPPLHDPTMSIAFADGGKYGMAMSYTPQAELTTNGGKSWHFITIPKNVNWSITQAQAAEQMAISANWSMATPFADMAKRQHPTEAIISNSQLGWMSTSDGQGIVLTTNGGQTWRTIHFASGLTQPMDIDFINAQDGWMITLFGALLQTTNGGQTWVHASHPVA